MPNHKIGFFEIRKAQYNLEDSIKWRLISDKSEVSERKTNRTYRGLKATVKYKGKKVPMLSVCSNL
jgi:hypothetical protein